MSHERKKLLRKARIKWNIWRRLTSFGDRVGSIQITPFRWADALAWWIANTFFDVEGEILEMLDEEDRANGVHIREPGP